MKFVHIALLFIYSLLNATIINVPSDQQTIQAGIEMAVEGDTVLVQPGTYTENINFNGKNIILTSIFLTTQDTSYISQTIIDGSQNGCVVSFENEENSNAIFSGFTIQNGLGNLNTQPLTGGGITCVYDSNPTLDNLRIINNVSECSGGGIYCYYSNPHITNCFISNNTASCGGGINCSYSNPYVENLTISNNHTTSHGGGVYCYDSSPNCFNVLVEDNSADGNGGGFYCSHYANLILENVVIKSNSANNGGGIYCLYFTDPNLINVSIINNSCVSYGGGIYCYNQCSPSLNNVTLSNNSSDEDGGGIYCFVDCSPNLVDVTISDNYADDEGGGIYLKYNNVNINLQNVTITNNTSNTGGGIFCGFSSTPTLINCILWDNVPQEIQVYLSPVYSITLLYSNIQGGEAGIEASINDTYNWLEGNIDSDPLFFDAACGDFHLLENSPCIDAGTAFFELNGEILIDLSEDDYYGIAPDMGVYEYGFLDVENVYEIPLQTYILAQNYPNPFNPSTTISFSIHDDSYVELSIFNIKGQKVVTLINDRMEKGKHSVIWTGFNENNNLVSSGIYYYKIKAGNQEKVKRMLLLK